VRPSGETGRGAVNANARQAEPGGRSDQGMISGYQRVSAGHQRESGAAATAALTAGVSVAPAGTELGTAGALGDGAMLRSSSRRRREGSSTMATIAPSANSEAEIVNARS